jgi:hypothetical protein
MNHSRSSRAATILVVSMLAVLGLVAADAFGAPITTPNPINNGVVKLALELDAPPPDGTGLLLGSRLLSFTDPAVQDGGNPAGTVFDLYLDERARGSTIPLTIADHRAQFTKSTNDEETFTFDPTLEPFDLDMNRFVIARPYYPASPYKGLHQNTQYMWRVDVNGAPGSNWRFYTDMHDPGDGSVDVSVYCRFVWDFPQEWLTNGPLTTQNSQEIFCLTDLTETLPSYVLDSPFVDIVDGEKVLIADRQMKIYTYDTNRSNGRDDVHEYWYYDEGYPGRTSNVGKLLPGRNYAWRILYADNDGLQFWDLNGNGAKDFNENWVWADGEDDFSDGWTFWTVREYHYAYFGINGPSYGDVEPVVDSEVESLIVFWQSPFGSRARDPIEGRWTFEADAAALQDIHENVHGPSIKTEIASNEMLAASFGGLHNDRPRLSQITPQQVFVPPIPTAAEGGWDGWYTWDRATKRVAPYWFFASEDPWGDGYYEGSAQDQYEEWIARGIRTFLQDATNGYPPTNGGFGYGEDSASFPNLQYVVIMGDADRVAPSFYFHHTGSPYFISPHWVPTDFFYMTQTDSDAVQIDPRYQVSRIPLRRASVYTEQPVIGKIRDYAELLNSPAKKSSAYNDWFGRVVMASGTRHWFQWYQMFPAFAQYLLGQQIDAGGGVMRDVFSGMRVRKYDIFSIGSEALTPSNIMRHLANSDPDDTPGFVYLLCQGFSTGNFADHTGQMVNLTPSDPPEDFTSAVFLEETMFPETFEGAVDGRRPLLINLAAVANSYHNDLWLNPVLSFGQAGVLAGGGPIASIGFANGDYDYDDTWTRELDSGTHMLSLLTGVDLAEGHQYLRLDKGVLRLEKDGNPDLAVAGKMELIKLLVKQYGSTTQAGIGNIFNKALQSYVTTHSTEFMANDKRVTPNIFGFEILGDCALVMPHIERSIKDNVRPVLTDVNPRTGTSVADYGVTPRYNSQDMPIHTIPRSDPYNPNMAAPVTIRIVTDAPAVRVRTMSPFLRNTSHVSGGWFSTTEVAENAVEIFPTVNGSYTYTFNAKSPSVYFLVIQAQNPAWVQGVDDPEWRWLQERWIYVQAVNKFEREPNSNILVIDMDQTNRYHLGRYQHVEHYIMPGFEQDVEDYYVNPARDGLGYEDGVEDPRDFPLESALPLLNKESGLSPAYRYMFWCGQPYEDSVTNAAAIKEGQRYYGEITPTALKSFQDSRGVVGWFSGDYARPAPEGYLVLFSSVEEDEAGFIKSYVLNGGRFFMSNQSLLDQIITVTGAANYTPFATDFLQTALSATGRVLDVDLTNMDGLRRGTFGELIQDVNAAGGDGADNAIATGEIDPEGVEALTAFNWDETSGPSGITPPEGTASTAVQSRLAAMGGRTVFFTWPLDAIDHAGDLGVDNSGRENVVKQVVDWLRSVPKAIAPDPADGAIGVSLSKTLSWSRVPEAEHYRLYLGMYQATFTLGPGITVDRDNPSYKPPTNLAQNTRYYWRVDTKNVDDYTIGDVWTFSTVAPAPRASNPVPSNGATQVPLDQLLSWAQDNQVDTYDITIREGAVNGPIFDTAPFLTDAEHQPSPRLEPNMTYFWRVDSRNELGLIQGTDWHFDTITPPPKPTVPDPANGAANVPTNKVFGWNATLRTDSYDVFVWRAVDTAPVANTVVAGFNVWSGTCTTNSYAPGELNTSTLYNWQVRPVNEAGRQDVVDTWTFTSSASVGLPSAPTNPNPPNGAAGVATNPTLTWSKAAGAYRYDVYFWIQGDPPPGSPQGLNVVSPNFTPPGVPLVIGTTYAWRVVAKNSQGAELSSPPWTFTVGAAKPINLFPANGALAVIPSVTFNWDDCAGADHYNIYIAQGTVLPGSPTATITDSEYKPPVDLVALSTYTWRVDAVSPAGDVTPSDVVQFATGTITGVPDQVTGMNPADGAVNVKVDVTLTWLPAAGAASYRIYLGAMVLPQVPTATGLTVTQYKPMPDLLNLTTYRWRVDAVGPDGVTVTPGIEIAFTTVDIGGGPPPTPGGGGASCFIATSAYESFAGAPGLPESNCTGSYVLAPERMEQLNDIRRLRDDMLLNVAAGRDFSAWYYAVGPYAAEAIRECEPAKAAVRAAVLDPLSALSRACREMEQ